MERILREKLVKGRFLNVPGFRSKMMGAIKSANNISTEQKFQKALIDAGITYFQVNAKLIGNPDISFPSYNVAVFLDGCFWHGCPKCGHIPKSNTSYWYTKIERNKERDINKRLALREQGLEVVQYWEHELKDDISSCVNLLKHIIEDNLLRISSYVEI
jgi:DNA mismatch endonuclease (patch repair protein)